MNKFDSQEIFRLQQAIVKYKENLKDQDGWLYRIDDVISEQFRFEELFRLERLGLLPKTHKQCSRSPEIPVPNNHLTCLLGHKTKQCPHLSISSKIKHITGTRIDQIKAFTCVTHIVSELAKGKVIDGGTGWIIDESDKLYWNRVHESLAGG